MFNLLIARAAYLLTRYRISARVAPTRRAALFQVTLWGGNRAAARAAYVRALGAYLTTMAAYAPYGYDRAPRAPLPRATRSAYQAYLGSGNRARRRAAALANRVADPVLADRLDAYAYAPTEPYGV